MIGEGAALFVLEDEAQGTGRRARPLARDARLGQHARCLSRHGATTGRLRRCAEPSVGRCSAQDCPTSTSTTSTRMAPARRSTIPPRCWPFRAALGSAADTVAVKLDQGAIGHLMAAAGAVELAACLLPFEA